MTATKGKASSRAKTTIKTKVTASDPKEISIKTRNKANTEFCNQCQGSLYVLTNVAGRVHGELCACFQCPECQGRGHIYIEDATGISSLRECVCAELVHSLKKINKAGIPGKFLGATFESFNPKHDSQKIALRYSRDFVNDYNEGGIKGLLFMGRPGVGKTHLAVSVIKDLMLDKGVDCKFVDFFQLLSDIRFGYSQNLSEQAIINPFVAAPVLVIDELAKGRNTEWELTMLDQIISARYNDSQKTTLITSNFVNEKHHNQNNLSNKETPHEEKIGPARYLPSPPEDQVTDETKVDTDSQDYKQGLAMGDKTMQDKVGERIYSRLVEMCRFVKLEGMDYRQEMQGKQTAPARSRKKI